MISGYFGLMGSGKSLLAVNRIYNNFSRDKEAKKEKNATFNKCYTNIGGFKFDKVDNTYNLDWDILYKVLTRLYSHYKSKKDDVYLVEFCRLVGIKDALFVIDEAQNHFAQDDKVIVWWLTYHRHLFHEIMLISPDISLIFLKYKKTIEVTYIAKPRSLTLDKRYFKYNQYSTYKTTKATHFGSIKIKANPKVFALYKSGDSVVMSNIVLKFIIIAFMLFLIILAIGYYFVSSKTQTTINVQKTQMQTTDMGVHPIEKKVTHLEDNSLDSLFNDVSENKLFILSCTSKLCTNQDILLPPKLLEIFIKQQQIKVLYREKINSSLKNIYMDTSIDFYKYISNNHKGENDDKENNVLNIFSRDNSSK